MLRRRRGAGWSPGPAPSPRGSRQRGGAGGCPGALARAPAPCGGRPWSWRGGGAGVAGPAAGRLGGPQEGEVPAWLPGDCVAQDGVWQGWPRSVVHGVGPTRAGGASPAPSTNVATSATSQSSSGGCRGGAPHSARTSLPGTWPLLGSGKAPRPFRRASSGRAAGPDRCCGGRWPTPRPLAEARPPSTGASLTGWTFATASNTHTGPPRVRRVPGARRLPPSALQGAA